MPAERRALGARPKRIGLTELPDRMVPAVMKLLSIITCPHCGYAATERMPLNVCQIFYDCKGCGARLKPKPGDCCMFCFYGSIPCPSMQHARQDSRPSR